MGRELALEEYPEKKICVIDSRSTAGCLVLLARKAKELIGAGDADFEEVCARLRIYQASLRTAFKLLLQTFFSFFICSTPAQS